MSKSIAKLLNEALVPTSLMICGKIAGLCLANTVFRLDWKIITNPNNLFSVRIVYPSQAQQIISTSYSNFIMYLLILIGVITILTKALYFHSSHISPHILTKLAKRNLLGLIVNSFEIYHQASAWLIVLWLSLFVLWINILLNNAYFWTGIVSLICTVFTTTIILQDITKEIEITEKHQLQTSNNP